jgi:hypothetical protein
MRRNAGNAREKNSRPGPRMFQFLAASSHRRPAGVGPTPDEKSESDSPESRSDGCAQSLWAARVERSDVKTRSRPESFCLACPRGHNPSSGRSRALGQRPTGDDWKWLRDGISTHLPLWSAAASLVREIATRSGVDLELGLGFYRTFQEAGLPAPAMQMEIPLGNDPEFIFRRRSQGWLV